MPADVISEVEFLDAEAVGRYRELDAQAIKAYGSRYLVRATQAHTA